MGLHGLHRGPGRLEGPAAEVIRRVTLRAAPGQRVRVVRRSIARTPSAGMPVVVDVLTA